MKRQFILIGFLLSVILLLEVCQLSISNRISTQGINLEDINLEIAKYKKENALIEEKILQATSLRNISQKAEKLGFTENSSKVYMTNPLPLALGITN